MNLNSPKDAIDVVSQHLRNLYKPYAGAQFRIAFFNDGTAKRFLTAYVLFCEQHIPSRPQTEFRQGDHGKFIFVEHWCREQWEAVKLLSQLLSGEAEIEGHKIEARFRQSDFERRTYPRQREFWVGHDLRSRRHHDGNWKEFRVPQGYLVRRGTSGYYGPDHAINDWIFNRDTWDTLAADVPDRDTVLTFLPDLRARILSADWRRPQLYLEVELKVPPEQMELQILYADSKSQFQTVPLELGEIKVDIPAGVHAFSLLLLDDSDNRIISFELDEHHTKFGKADPHAGRPTHGSTLLDSVELAFVDPSGVGLAEDQSFLQIDAANGDRQFMEMATDEARKSKAEDGRVHPRVGVVVVKDGRLLAAAHRGEFPGCHAEYIALEKKLKDSSIAGATIYTTLEPCTTRNHPKIPCASRLIERKVARVVIGMLDPNPEITGRGQRALRKARIATELFPHDLMDEIEELNREFTRSHDRQITMIGQDRPTSNAVVDVQIIASKFRASQATPTEPVWVSFQFRLDIGNRGAKTTLNAQEIDIPELALLENHFYGFFSGERDNNGQRITLESGYSGIVTCSVTGKTAKTMSEIPSEVSGQIVFRETLTGNLPMLTFRAVQETL